MDSKNVIAAIALSSAVIVLYSLFFIPDQVGGLPVFGLGLLLTLWLIGGAVVLVYLVRKQGFNADTKSYLPVFVIVSLGIISSSPDLNASR